MLQKTIIESTYKTIIDSTFKAKHSLKEKVNIDFPRHVWTHVFHDNQNQSLKVYLGLNY